MATVNEIISKIRSSSIPEGKMLHIGNGSEGWMAQIQNHGAEEVDIKYNSSKIKSGAWGRIWFRGNIKKQFHGPLNVVKNDMIKYLESPKMSGEDSAMEYDPITCMMVPKKANDAKIWVVEYEDALGDDHKKTFTDKTTVEKFIRRGTDVGRAYHLKVNGKAVNNMSTWTADAKANDMKFKVSYDKGRPGGTEEVIEASSYEEAKRKAANSAKGWGFEVTRANDASRVIKQRNGYTLGINSQGTIYLAFPGETENNPHMYLGKENDKNLNDAKILFEKFASTRDSAMIYDEVMAMMKPVTVKDQKTVDYPNWSSAMNHMRDIERKLDTARSNALKELGTVKREIDNLLGSSDITADVEKMLVAEFDRLYKKVNG